MTRETCSCCDGRGWVEIEDDDREPDPAEIEAVRAMCANASIHVLLGDRIGLDDAALLLNRSRRTLQNWRYEGRDDLEWVIVRGRATVTLRSIARLLRRRRI